MILAKQRMGPDTKVAIVGTNEEVRSAIEQSEFNEEIVLT